jgi:hypothetical protein
MICALKGKLSPHFIDNVFETMQKVDETFAPSINRLPLVKIYLICSTELVSGEELREKLRVTGKAYRVVRLYNSLVVAGHCSLLTSSLW